MSEQHEGKETKQAAKKGRREPTTIKLVKVLLVIATVAWATVLIVLTVLDKIPQP